MEIKLLRRGNVTLFACKMQMQATTEYRLKNNIFCHVPHTILFLFLRRAESKTKKKRFQKQANWTAIYGGTKWIRSFASNDTYTRYILCSWAIGTAWVWVYCTRSLTPLIWSLNREKYWLFDNLARFAIPKRRHAAAAATHGDRGWMVENDEWAWALGILRCACPSCFPHSIYLYQI